MSRMATSGSKRLRRLDRGRAVGGRGDGVAFGRQAGRRSISRPSSLSSATRIRSGLTYGARRAASSGRARWLRVRVDRQRHRELAARPVALAAHVDACRRAAPTRLRTSVRPTPRPASRPLERHVALHEHVEDLRQHVCARCRSPVSRIADAHLIGRRRPCRRWFRRSARCARLAA